MHKIKGFKTRVFFVLEDHEFSRPTITITISTSRQFIPVMFFELDNLWLAIDVFSKVILLIVKKPTEVDFCTNKNIIIYLYSNWMNDGWFDEGMNGCEWMTKDSFSQSSCVQWI